MASRRGPRWEGSAPTRPRRPRGLAGGKPTMTLLPCARPRARTTGPVASRSRKRPVEPNRRIPAAGTALAGMLERTGPKYGANARCGGRMTLDPVRGGSSARPAGKLTRNPHDAPATAANWGSQRGPAPRGSPRSFPYEGGSFSLTNTNSRTPLAGQTIRPSGPNTSSGVRETKRPAEEMTENGAGTRTGGRKPEANFSEATGPLSNRRPQLRPAGAPALCSSTVGAPRSGTGGRPPCPGVDTSEVWRCTGVSGSNVRRSRGTCASLPSSPAPAPRTGRAEGCFGIVVRSPAPPVRLRQRGPASSRPYPLRHTNRSRPPSRRYPRAASRVSMESRLAFSTKPHVFTTTMSAPLAVGGQLPSRPRRGRAASSSESTSLRAQPSVSRATRRAGGLIVTGHPPRVPVPPPRPAALARTPRRRA